MNFWLTKTFDLLKLSRKIIPLEIFVLNSLLILLGNLKTWIISRLVYVLLIAQFRRTLDLILRAILKYSFSWYKEFNDENLFFQHLIHVFKYVKLDMTENQSRIRFDIQICELKFMILLWNIFECGWCGPGTSFSW